MSRENPVTRILSAMLCAVLLLEPFTAVRALAQEAATTTSQESLERARGLIKDGDYDGAIEVLKKTMEHIRPNFTELREAYLLLIKTYVFLGNDQRYKPQGKESSALNYKAARELIAECLSYPQLRNTRPEPASEYPPEMITAFAEVRAAMFGSFQVIGLQPPDATVTFDADTLRPMADTTAATVLGAVDIPVGPHVVGVSRPGYRTQHEEVTISPGGTFSQSYKLTRQRGKGFYAAVAGGTALVIAGVVALIPDNTKTEQPLPGPPGPPSGARRR